MTAVVGGTALWAVRSMLVGAVLVALLLAACGGRSGGGVATQAVNDAGYSVTKCVPAWSGYDGDVDPDGTPYDGRAYQGRAVSLSRWRCKLALPRDGRTQWCFSWVTGSEAEDLGYPANLNEDHIGRRC